MRRSSTIGTAVPGSPSRGCVCALAAVASSLLALSLTQTAAAGAGDLDTTFSGDGTVVTAFPGHVDANANSVEVQSDGRIDAAGYAATDGPGDTRTFSIARYLSDGTLDASFSEDGLQTVDVGPGGVANDVAIQRDGRVVLVGCAGCNDTGAQIVVVRLTSAGDPDPGFGDNGELSLPIPINETVFNEGVAVALGRHGSILVGAYSRRRHDGINHHTDFLLARLTPSGKLDRSFAGDGLRWIDFRRGYDIPGDLALGRHGKIVIAGCSLKPTRYQAVAFARVRSSGNLDRSFGQHGMRLLKKPGGCANEVALEGRGRVVAAGAEARGAHHLERVWSLRRDGSPDRSFSGDGTALVMDHADGTGLAVQSNGKIVVSGYRTYAPEFLVSRLKESGRLDRSFAGDGSQETPFSDVAIPNDVALQPDGKIVLAGQVSNVNGFAVARYDDR